MFGRAVFSGTLVLAGLLTLAVIGGLIVREPAVAVLTVVLGGAALAALRRPAEPRAPAVCLAAADVPLGGSCEPAGLRGAHPRTSILAPWGRTLDAALRLPVILGEIAGRPTWLDLAAAPHVLIGGSTGSGKSTFLHSAIVSGTALQAPERLRVVLIDPKRVELNRYRGLAHVAAYVSENPDARRVLTSVEREMDRRYQGMDALGARDISETREPRVLVVIDEFADLVLTTRRTPNDVEGTLSRLLALGRAAGVHVILATQRPDAKVVTGLIKANAPTRIAFRTSNGVESRIILDVRGAEALPGRGAGLIVSHQVPNTEKPGTPVRFQGYHIPYAEIDAYVRSVSPLTSPPPTGRMGA